MPSRFQIQDQIMLDQVKSENRAKNSFQQRYGWILDENARTRELLKKFELKEPNPDTRSAKPFPETTNQMYGWPASHSDFKLEIYGPDVFPPKPLPDIYKLNLTIKFT